MGNISSKRDEKTVYVALPEQIDIKNAGEIRNEVKQLIEEQKDKDYTFDLTRTAYLDSVGLGMLVGFQRKIFNNGKDVVFLNPSRKIMRVFETTQLDKVFKIITSDKI